MGKLSESHVSLKWLENKFGIHLEPLSVEMQQKPEDASSNANKNITRNNGVYQSSNSRGHLYLTEKSNRDFSILATDFSKVNQSMENWHVQREKKGKIYEAFSDYILCLEDSLEREEDSYRKYLIKQEIKKLKKEQKKYYVPSMLEGARLDLLYSGNHKKQSLEHSDHSLAKAIEKRFKK